MFLRLPSYNDPSKDLMVIAVGDIKYYRTYKENGVSSSCATIIYFKDGHNVKVDVTEQQVSKMLMAAGITLIGFNEL